MLTLAGPLPRLDAVAFSPDGAEVAAGGGTSSAGPGGVVVWRPGGPAGHRHLLRGGVADAVGYSADGRRLFAKLTGATSAAGPPAGLYVLGRTRPHDPGEWLGARTTRFAVAGDRLLLAEWVRPPAGRLPRWHVGRLTALDLAPGPPFPVRWVTEYPDGGVPWAAALLPDGRPVTLDSGPNGYVRVLRDADTGRPVASAPLPGRSAGPLVVSPAGDWLAANAGGSLYLWPAADWKAATRKVVFGRRHCKGAAFTPDGHLLAAGNDGTVRRIDPTTGATLASYTFTAGKMRSVAVAPDGLTAAVGTDRGTVVVFDLE